MAGVFPSFLTVTISTIVFFIALRIFNRQLEAMEIEKHMARSMLALTLATLVALTAGKVVDIIETKFKGPQKTHTQKHAPAHPAPNE